MIQPNIVKFIDAVELLGRATAKEACSIGYVARGMVQASMPYRAPQTTTFCRKNGALTLTMTALTPSLGLPYGAIPRLLLAWVGREAVVTGDRHIQLGDSLADFLREMGLFRTGGARGDITRLKEQTARLFSTAVNITYNNMAEIHSKNLLVADEYSLWNQFVDESSEKMWHSSVILSETFFEEIVRSPVPLDLRVYKLLKASPMAIDIYSWLSYRYSYLRRHSPPISWKSLEMQFGANYSRTRDFRHAVVEALQKVKIVYPAAKYTVSSNGLILYPSATHITRC